MLNFSITVISQELRNADFMSLVMLEPQFKKFKILLQEEQLIGDVLKRKQIHCRNNQNKETDSLS